MIVLRRHRNPRTPDSGQALVEFAFSIIPFLLLVVGLFDLGRAVYTYNGLSEATREIARVTAVNPGLTLGTSTETTNRIAVQAALVPQMGTPTFECANVDGTANSHIPCRSGDYVRVTISSTYTPVSLLGIGGPITLTSSASIRIP
jgi:Flp pilus assembly protein TadG